MDVLETKYLSTDLNFMYKLLQFNNNPVRLVGTGSMASQYYPADFDFLCQVKKRPNLQNTYNCGVLNHKLGNYEKAIDYYEDAAYFKYPLAQKALSYCYSGHAP